MCRYEECPPEVPLLPLQGHDEYQCINIHLPLPFIISPCSYHHLPCPGLANKSVKCGSNAPDWCFTLVGRLDLVSRFPQEYPTEAQPSPDLSLQLRPQPSSFINMGSGASREGVIDSKWWEAKAYRMLITTASTRDVELICSLIPFTDETTLLGLLKGRSDLDTLFILHCKQNVPEQQSGDPSKFTDELKAQELWRVLRFPSGCSASWDWNWQPPRSGDPHKIADDFHAAVCRAVFRIPLSDFVKYALGYNSKALSVVSLFNAACDVRSSLQTAFQGRPETKGTYVEVEKVACNRIAWGDFGKSTIHSKPNQSIENLVGRDTMGIFLLRWSWHETSLLSALVSFSGIMSHNLLIICYRNQSENNAIGPRKTSGSIQNPAFYSGRLILNDKKFYWRDAYQSLTPADKLSCGTNQQNRNTDLELRRQESGSCRGWLERN
jgi:hypothetical protein